MLLAATLTVRADLPAGRGQGDRALREAGAGGGGAAFRSENDSHTLETEIYEH